LYQYQTGRDELALCKKLQNLKVSVHCVCNGFVACITFMSVKLSHLPFIHSAAE